MKTLRLSYTLIDTWLSGDKDKAVETYLHIPRTITAAMQRGIDFDKYCKEYVTKEKKMPPELGGKILDKPVAPYPLACGYNEMITLKGEIDILNGEEIIDVKCGEAMDSAQYVETLQLPFYMFIMSEIHLSVPDYGTIYRWDPVRRILDTSTIYRTKRLMDEVRQTIETTGKEIYAYFDEQEIL